MADDKPTSGSHAEKLGRILRDTLDANAANPRGVRDSIEVGEEPYSYVKEALKWQYNWIGLLGAAAFAVVSGSGLPLILAAGLELVYVSLVPQSSRFRRLVRSWKYAEEKRRHDMKLARAFQELPSEMRLRYADLDKLCRVIRANYDRLSSTAQIFVRQMKEQLEDLLAAYLRLLHAAYLHREYLRSTDPDGIRRDVESLKKALAGDSPKVQEINRKRIEILTKRLEKHEKVRENCQVVDAQCAAIEDVLELIRDQSVTLRDPQEVTGQLEDLVREVEQTEETVRQVEAIYEMTAPELGAGIAPLGDERNAAPAGSDRRRLRRR
jgi:hypothetical protein